MKKTVGFIGIGNMGKSNASWNNKFTVNRIINDKYI